MYPPSIFEGIPQSILSNPFTKANVTRRTSNHAIKNTFEDELPEFGEYDHVAYSTLKEALLNNRRQFYVPLAAFINNNSLYLQSLSYFNGISLLLIIISESLKYEMFHLGVT